MKRLFELLFSTLLMLALLPLFVLVALLVKLDSSGPVLYLAQRAGKQGKPFRLVKFRSMVTDASKLGPGITRHQDARITRVGKWLRKFKIDELPQFINVLKGEMAIVGPRPETPEIVAHYTAEQRRILSMQPGITSAASLAYRDEESLLAGEDWEAHYLQHIMPEKIRIDLQYHAQQTFWSDLKLIFQTAFAMFQ